LSEGESIAVNAKDLADLIFTENAPTIPAS
jgi:hypothetical protein